MPTQIQNPVPPGFHAVGWWPAVRIHHSADLAQGHHRGAVLTRSSQFDLAGTRRAAGFDPCSDLPLDA